MSRVITFSRVFPSYHPKAGQPTYFVEAISLCLAGMGETLFDDYHEMTVKLNPKHHTIRAGHRWKVGDKFCPRVWSGKPYRSPQRTIGPDIEVKKVWDFSTDGVDFFLNGELVAYASSPSEMFLEKLAANDGLSEEDLLAWFQYPKEFDGQIICWSDNVEY